MVDKKIHEGTMKVGQAHGDEDGATPKDKLDLFWALPLARDGPP